mmetsp:Transcript_19059/g.48899  ORF Transcript_19059/g.48899 Transcript_19059/m.48899 type:complete len:213 (+) Transcript_19059:33-671(+)
MPGVPSAGRSLAAPRPLARRLVVLDDVAIVRLLAIVLSRAALRLEVLVRILVILLLLLLSATHRRHRHCCLCGLRRRRRTFAARRGGHHGLHLAEVLDLQIHLLEELEDAVIVPALNLRKLNLLAARGDDDVERASPHLALREADEVDVVVAAPDDRPVDEEERLLQREHQPWRSLVRAVDAEELVRVQLLELRGRRHHRLAGQLLEELAHQ